MRFGRLPAEEAISSKALYNENRKLEEKLLVMNKVLEEEKLKSQNRNNVQHKNKVFSIRNIRRGSKQKESQEIAVGSNPQLKNVLVKKGIRAYEEVVKNKLQSRKQDKSEYEIKLLELGNFLEGIKMGKFVDPFKKIGINSVEDLKNTDLKKLNLLPGFELKLSKRLSEYGCNGLKRDSLLPPPGSRDKEREKIINESTNESDSKISHNKGLSSEDEDEEYLTSSKPKPSITGKNRKYQSIVMKHRSLHEDSTMSDLKKVVATAETGFGADPLAKKHCCWHCAIMISEGQNPVNHPVFEGKVETRSYRLFVPWAA